MKLTILSTSDTHGFVLPTTYQDRTMDAPFSLARAKSVIDPRRDDATIVIENGDFLQGSALAYHAAKIEKNPAIATQAYNTVGYTVGVLGNHEFNYGSDYLKAALATLDYPILAANIQKDGEPAFGPGYEIVERGGFKVAVLGLTTSYIPHWESPEHIAGLQFFDALEVARQWVPKLHQQADVVVVAYHGGFERDPETGEATEMLTTENVGYALTQLPGVDALVTGHQHREVAALVNGVPATQPGYRGAYVGEITLELTREADGSVTVSQPTAELLPTAAAQPDATIMTFLADANATVQAWLDQPLGRVEGDMTIRNPFEARRREHPYIEFINRVEMDAAGTDIAGTALFSDDGQGFGAAITMRDVITNYIYPNTLAVVRLSGADIRAMLEKNARYFVLDDAGQLTVNPRFIEPKPQHYNYDMYQGLDYTLDIRRPFNERVTRLEYHGAPVQDTAEYELAVNQYRAVGGGNFAMFGPEKIVREIQIDMTELIADYLRAHPVINASVDNNFTVLPD